MLKEGGNERSRHKNNIIVAFFIFGKYLDFF